MKPASSPPPSDHLDEGDDDSLVRELGLEARGAQLIKMEAASSSASPAATNRRPQ